KIKVDHYVTLQKHIYIIKDYNSIIEKKLLEKNNIEKTHIIKTSEKLDKLLKNSYETSIDIKLKEINKLNHTRSEYISNKSFDKIDTLNVSKVIDELHNLTNEKIKLLRDELQKAVLSTIFLFIVVIIIFSIYYFKEYKKNLMTARFRSAIENSDNIIVITDYYQKILYVNQSFTDSTGYIFNEVVGKTPSILRSSVMPKTFYKELNEKIYSGKKWQGEFINIDKNGHRRYEKASILPIFDSKGKIYNFLSIKLDITKEVEANQKIKEHEQTILHQSKMASMGEMLENIAHQWRQPLSTITTVASGMSMQKEVDILDDETFNKSIKTIMENSNYLSKTIDDFRNFFKSEKDHLTFNLKDSIQKALNISDSKLKSKFIQEISSLKDIYVSGIDGEIMQVVLNLYSNAADAFDIKDKNPHYIFTELYEKNNVAVIKVRDNAGGIPKDYISKIFEPYFTTKHKNQGTGIGLYMSHEIVKNTFKGAFDVHNLEYEYNGEKLSGAEFIIKIPIDYDENEILDN
ncbi:MAG: PAS domain-containing sensor histidine kinase, partial [Sphaerochaetaceae bacterium]|nr:PAS domain-containing sensor histidine kinase [Sphaerochaetaceae bacterium]